MFLVHRRVLAVAACAALVTAVSCGRQLERLTAVNQAPEVEFISNELVAPAADAAAVRTIVRWRGTDPDGRIDHYLVAVNPRSLDTPDASWQRTSTTAWLASGEAGEPLIVAVRAVDARGAESPTAHWSVLDGNIAPLVRITVPMASPLLNHILKAGQKIRWEGIDPDGRRHPRPVAYKFRFFFESEGPIDWILVDPDSLRRLYAPGYEGWETVRGHITSTAVPDGPAFDQGTFAVVAVDAQGATTAPFTLSTNVLRMRRAHPDTPLGPLLTVYNAGFNITTAGPVPPAMPPTFEYAVPVAANRPVTLNWYGTPPPGLEIEAYRWGLDLENVLDASTGDDDPAAALPPVGVEHGGDRVRPGRWSRWSPRTTSATVGPFRGDDALRDHVVSIETRDNMGNITLVAIRLQLIQAPLTRRLLIVDDTRLRPDRMSNGVLAPPVGPWPTAAELDTFLFARGGFEWQGYPAGTLSPSGLFARYDCDTLGTRTGQADLTVPLETLLHYRSVIWITDAIGATYSRAGTDPSQPQTALRYMTAPGRINTLAQYAAQGGRVWILGGGAGFASTIEWNRTANDMPTTRFSAMFDELAPGRFMWDVPHWRSEFRVASAPITAFARTSDGGAEFARLPASFNLKTPATDPLPPLRSPGDFYRTVVPLEFLTQPNEIVEGHGRHPSIASNPTLDTLYTVTSSILGSDPSPAPVVTYYHGREAGRALFSGADLWSYRRDQCQQMVDAVLQDLWHLSPTAVAEPMRRARPTARVVPSTPRPNGQGMTTARERVGR